MNAEAIARALGSAHRSGAWWRARCAVHQSTGPTLALRDGWRGVVAHCHAGYSRDEVIAELARLGLFDESAIRAEAVDPAAMERQLTAVARDRQRRIDQALLIWRHETADPHGTAVEQLLARPRSDVADTADDPSIRASAAPSACHDRPCDPRRSWSGCSSSDLAAADGSGA